MRLTQAIVLLAPAFLFTACSGGPTMSSEMDEDGTGTQGSSSTVGTGSGGTEGTSETNAGTAGSQGSASTQDAGISSGGESSSGDGSTQGGSTTEGGASLEGLVECQVDQIPGAGFSDRNIAFHLAETGNLYVSGGDYNDIGLWRYVVVEAGADGCELQLDTTFGDNGYLDIGGNGVTIAEDASGSVYAPRGNRDDRRVWPLPTLECTEEDGDYARVDLIAHDPSTSTLLNWAYYDDGGPADWSRLSTSDSACVAQVVQGPSPLVLPTATAVDDSGITHVLGRESALRPEQVAARYDTVGNSLGVYEVDLHPYTSPENQASRCGGDVCFFSPTEGRILKYSSQGELVSEFAADFSEAGIFPRNVAGNNSGEVFVFAIDETTTPRFFFVSGL